MTAQGKKRPSIHDRLVKLGACLEAREWAAGYKSPKKAWAECRRGDWMLWVVGRTVGGKPWGDERKPLLACVIDCAITVKHLWPESHKDEIAASVKVLRAWAKGKATAEAAKQAKERIWQARRADAAYAADAAAYAADAAAYAAAYAAAAAAYAAYAADAAADAAYADAADAARTKVLAKCADIVRRHFPNPPNIS